MNDENPIRIQGIRAAKLGCPINKFSIRENYIRMHLKCIQNYPPAFRMQAKSAPHGRDNMRKDYYVVLPNGARSRTFQYNAHVPAALMERFTKLNEKPSQP